MFPISKTDHQHRFYFLFRLERLGVVGSVREQKSKSEQSAKMYLFNDILSDHTLFTDMYHVQEAMDGLCYKFTAKVSTEKQQDYQLEGANPSCEEEQEQYEASEGKTGLDCCLKYQLEDLTGLFTKKTLGKYLAQYIKSLKKADPEADKEITELLQRRKTFLNDFVSLLSSDASIYGEGQESEHGAVDPEDPKKALMVGVWNENGKEVDMYVLKCCVRKIKC